MNREEISALEAAWRIADNQAVEASTSDARLAAGDVAAAILVLLDVMAAAEAR